MEIVWTLHANGRQRQWKRRLGVTKEEVESLVKSPEQIVPGDKNAMVAQTRRGKGLLRCPFIEMEGKRKILTVYWTSNIKKYWKEE